MRTGRVVSWRPSQLSRLTGALAALALAWPARGAASASLELTVGPHQTSFLQLKELAVLVDGQAVPVAVPARGYDPALPVYQGTLTPGSHRIEVRAGFTGDSRLFSYVEGYVFRMAGHVEVTAPEGQVVSLAARVKEQGDLTTAWTDRYRLALQARGFDGEIQEEAEVVAAVAPAPAPEVAVAVPAVASVPAEPAAPAAPCQLPPARFATGRHALDAVVRGALDRFAECLARGAGSARIEGFADPRGSAALNDRLSEARAREVAAYLVRRGVARERLAVRGYGATRQVCAEATPECWARNRRAEAIPEER